MFVQPLRVTTVFVWLVKTNFHSFDVEALLSSFSQETYVADRGRVHMFRGDFFYYKTFYYSSLLVTDHFSTSFNKNIVRAAAVARGRINSATGGASKLL